MSQPISVDISDDEEPQNDAVSTRNPPQSKRQRTEPLSNPTFLVIDDDLTPQKPQVSTSTPLFVDETLMSGLSDSDFCIVKCTSKGSSEPQKFSGISGVICLESDNESENGSEKGNWKQNERSGIALDVVKDSELRSRLIRSESYPEERVSVHGDLTQMSGHSFSHLIFSDGIPQLNDIPDEEIAGPELAGNVLQQKHGSKVDANKEKNVSGGNRKKSIAKEERIRLKEVKKQLREQEKLQKAAMKAEAAELRKLEKEKKKWGKGKFALKSIVAEIDTKVVELGSVGGHLLSRFAEKGLTYRITSNPIERSIVWNMAVPEQISQLSSDTVGIPYVLIIFEAEEFCNLVMNESFMDHVSCVRSRYPSQTICYLTNRLMAYINKREQVHYKKPGNCSSWRRPPVEEVLSRLITHFIRVHSRQCVDEAELAEHVVGLTCSLASCQFRKKLTRLSVNANGSLIAKDCVDKNLIKKSLWLKALVAIPKVQPRFAIAIGKKYPTMKSLLSVYMDPNKSVYEREFLLKDLPTEGLVGEDRRLGEVCSKRVYRILMAQYGSIKTDDVEDGADFFSRNST
ncbi:Crossover junction endonuclease [Actinidia chinensis var. chinensis]|uniref:Crossover junction endonuclease n=1 Tax=Actinidia chinensis var. chinensis TaxID=1590841 RepID=A0A2R6RJR0_ACTCC|nr:Crossover junction endonuclease [Actinidia chinensis var. chinensis]